MPPPEGPQWEFFHKGPLKNKSQHEAYCLGYTDDDTSALGNSGATGRKAKAPPKLFPRSLNILFGGVLKKPVGKPRREQFTREVLLMELLAAEESDEELDDGALSGSGDEFEE
ncbi:hypothetical protein C8F04DRAFT_1195660 [Mycena alexandri]|uniref:Uncharacterized protein n=1 Tax=Mycena alexandri TaxID=1745969 RepID=A0AAD6S6E9_9AGAR|nr:hypothetical protein C8F04DRAFT_1195660 [Mycena alexandri]